MNSDPLDHTVYPHCPDCNEICHGCRICGFVFCCSKCEPCHENIVFEGGVVPLFIYLGV